MSDAIISKIIATTADNVDEWIYLKEFDVLALFLIETDYNFIVSTKDLPADGNVIELIVISSLSAHIIIDNICFKMLYDINQIEPLANKQRKYTLYNYKYGICDLKDCKFRNFEANIFYDRYGKIIFCAEDDKQSFQLLEKVRMEIFVTEIFIFIRYGDGTIIIDNTYSIINEYDIVKDGVIYYLGRPLVSGSSNWLINSCTGEIIKLNKICNYLIFRQTYPNTDYYDENNVLMFINIRRELYKYDETYFVFDYENYDTFPIKIVKHVNSGKRTKPALHE